MRIAIQVYPVGVDDDELGTALADRLLDPQVDDWDVVLDVGRHHDNDARVIYLSDGHGGPGRGWNRGPAVHLDLRALQRPIQQAAEEIRLLVGEVGGQRDAQLRTLALDPGGGRRQRVRPGRLRSADGRSPKPGGLVDVRVVKAAAVADPALVDVAVLTRGDAHQLPAPLPHRHVAADRALRADARGVRH